LRPSSQPLDVAIAAIAAKQNGNITTEQLFDLGLNKQAIAYRVRIGRLLRVFRGVYSVGRRPVTPQEWASAAVLACGPRAVLSHSSAMSLWGFWPRWGRPYEVTVVDDRRPRKMIVVHRSTALRRHDVTTHQGIRVTSPARALLDMTPRMNDRQLKRRVNDALHSPWMTEGHLAETLALHPTRPGATRIAALIGLPGTPTRSHWEDGFPEFCETQGLPTPVMGAPLPGGYIADALFPEERVIVELDSWEFHRNRIAFERDRERDAETLAHGYVTVRMTWERIERRPDREGTRLRSILAQRLRGNSVAHAPSAA
jgi:Transcriptional regulator, AbiEi antitoxin/Protein of unknown function (DUF559)